MGVVQPGVYIELTPLPVSSRKLQVEGHWQSLNRWPGLNVGRGGAGSTGVGGSGAMIGQTLPGSEQTSALCHCATRVKLFYGCTSYTRRARIGCIDLLTPGAPRSHTRTDEGSLGRASCALITVI